MSEGRETSEGQEKRQNWGWSASPLQKLGERKGRGEKREKKVRSCPTDKEAIGLTRITSLPCRAEKEFWREEKKKGKRRATRLPELTEKQSTRKIHICMEMDMKKEHKKAVCKKKEKGKNG